MPRTPESYNEDLNIDPVQDLLWSSKLRATRPRIATVRALSLMKQPVSVMELHVAVKKEISTINTTSIYRTLESLVESGDVSRINTGKVHASYEIVRGRKHHHHIICTKCGDIEDIEGLEKCPAKKITGFIESESKKFNIIHNHSLEFFGQCKKCS